MAKTLPEFEHLQGSIEKLKSQFLNEDPGAIAELERWESDVKRAARTANAKKNPAVKMVIDRAQREIQTANHLLTTDRKLTDQERSRIFDRLDMWTWFLNMFDEADKTIDTIKKQVEDELS